MNFLAPFLLGLLGGVHCAGMCGPLVLALPIPAGGPGRFVLGRIAYQLGRIFTYCLLGVGFGLLGRGFALAGVQRGASIALGVLLLAGLLASRQLRLLGPILRLVGGLRQAMSGLLQRRSLTAQALLGSLNGLLPCGLVYVAGAAAAAEGGIPGGVGFMAAFGLGTLPTMLGLSLSGRLLPVAFRLRLRHAAPAAVVMLSALLILRGLALGIPYLSPEVSPGGDMVCTCPPR